MINVEFASVPKTLIFSLLTSHLTGCSESIQDNSAMSYKVETDLQKWYVSPPTEFHTQRFYFTFQNIFCLLFW